MKFTEIQRFNRPWHWVVFIFLLALVALSFKTTDNLIGAARLSAYWGTAVVCLVCVLWLAMRLETRIDSDGLHYRYFPFHLQTRHLSWDDIDSITVKNYRPLAEYGGWGLRFRGFDFSDVLLNVSGRTGIRVYLKNGKKRMIGTRKGEDAQQAIDTFFSSI